MSTPDKVAAFFDLDGTVVAPPSLEWRFITFLVARDELATRDVTRWLTSFLRRVAFDPGGATRENKQYLAGLRTSLAADWESSLAERRPPLYASALAQMNWHYAQGHRVFLISGTLAFLAQALARQVLGSAEVSATELEVRDGRWTGRLAGPHIRGAEKARAVRNLTARYGLSLWDSYAYGNSTSDLPMLDSVGHRFAVNPGAGLRRIAWSEGWPRCHWRQVAGRIASGAQLSAGQVR